LSFERYPVKCNAEICPSCELQTVNVNYRYSYSGGKSFVYRCDNCSLEFLRPLALAEINERRMESITDAEMFDRTLLKNLHRRFIIQPEINMVRMLLGRRDFNMLDVGCGTGWISRIWADSGASVTGLEPSDNRAAIARKRGLRVLQCYVEDLDIDERFDLIVARHVIEHIENPRVMLKNLASRLSNDGLLLLVVPNIDCIGRKVFDADWNWVLPWHCSFFSPHSLLHLLNSCGFHAEKLYQTPSPLYYPRSFFRRYPKSGKFFGNSSLYAMSVFIPLIVIGYLTGCCDNISVFARLESENSVS